MQRFKTVALTDERGWSAAAAAQRFQVTAKTARKRLRRYEAEGRAGPEDRCSRPHSPPNATPEPKQQEVIKLRRAGRRGALGFAGHFTHGRTGARART